MKRDVLGAFVVGIIVAVVLCITLFLKVRENAEPAQPVPVASAG